MIVNKTKPIKAVENAGYLNIYYEDDEFHIELHVGAQSFRLHYSDDNYESARWMAKQFAHALNSMVGDVRLYGTEPARLDNTPKRFGLGPFCWSQQNAPSAT